MKPLCVLLVCSASLAAGPVVGQSGVSDPISGTWIGDAAPRGASDRQAITVVLQLQTGNLTGTVTGPPRPGVIRRGSFDPATGDLRFEVEVDAGAAPFVFTGMVVSGTALGRVTRDGLEGDFRIVKGSQAAKAAVPGGVDAGLAPLRFGFRRVSEWVSQAATLVPAESYAYQPTSTVRTFGRLVAHIADSYAYYCGVASGQDTQWSDEIEKGSADKATVMRQLERTLATCTAVYDGGGRIEPLLENVAHTYLHYGNMITYLRLLGLVPPSSS